MRFPPIYRWQTPAGFVENKRSVGGRLLLLMALSAFVVAFQRPANADGLTTFCNGTLNPFDGQPSPAAVVAVSPNPLVNDAAVSVPTGSCSASASVSATDTIIADAEGDIATFKQDATATVAGSIGPGRISLFASAAANSTPQSYTFLPGFQPVRVNNNEQAIANAGIFGGWTDLFTVLGPPGTNVTLQFTESFTLSGGGTGRDILSTPATQPALFGTGVQTFDSTFPAGGTFAVSDVVFVSASACAGGPTSSLGGDIFIGPPFGCGTGSYIASSSATADASRTGLLFVQDLTPGTSFTTASGFDYAPPRVVPEPPSMLLLGSGLLGLGPLVRRRLARPASRAS